MIVIRGILGVCCGLFVGTALGFAIAKAIGLIAWWTHPDDPSASSASIVVILTAPIGAVLGVILGGLSAVKRPRIFYYTFLPLAILLAGFLVTMSTLNGMDRSRNYVLEIQGTDSARYVGIATADGAVHKLEGSLPDRLEFNGLNLKFAIALVSPSGKESIAVEVSANGNDLHTGYETQTGVQQELTSSGYSEQFGGTSLNWHRMSQDEVDVLIKKHSESRPPETP